MPFSTKALILNGGQGWNGTTDTRIFSPVLKTSYVAELKENTCYTVSNISVR